jgi:hypothetical protein
MLLGGAAAWPVAARAQRGERVPRIAVLMNQGTDNPEGRARFAAFTVFHRQVGRTAQGDGAEYNASCGH